ncbi:hypothetical protein K439DRAFT_1664759 [Ramaria rubella]|nr:hypothetical protein K439DRAFT_1664759 [Ramaria rubella]
MVVQSYPNVKASSRDTYFAALDAFLGTIDKWEIDMLLHAIEKAGRSDVLSYADSRLFFRERGYSLRYARLSSVPIASGWPPAPGLITPSSISRKERLEICLMVAMQSITTPDANNSSLQASAKPINRPLCNLLHYRQASKAPSLPYLLHSRISEKFYHAIMGHRAPAYTTSPPVRRIPVILCFPNERYGTSCGRALIDLLQKTRSPSMERKRCVYSVDPRGGPKRIATTSKWLASRARNDSTKRFRSKDKRPTVTRTASIPVEPSASPQTLYGVLQSILRSQNDKNDIHPTIVLVLDTYAYVTSTSLCPRNETVSDGKRHTSQHASFSSLL